MEVTTCGQAVKISTWSGLKINGAKPSALVRLYQRNRKECSLQVINLRDLKWKSIMIQQRRSNLGISHYCEASQDPRLDSENFYAPFDGNWLLKTKAQEAATCLGGRCIFLVGMMGSGKTTVGKILSEALGYYFVDSDKYVEEAVGGTPVAQIFNQLGENFFREYESEALRKLSLMPRQVVATGGGAVVRPVNWRFMRQGITVFLDVPLDALARRIAAVGTDSRPLLHFKSGDAYTKAFTGLITLSKKRADTYASADVTVSLLHLADNLGLEDVNDITPTAIAIEVLVQIEKFLRGNSNRSIQMFP